MYAGRVARCSLVSHVEYAPRTLETKDGTDENTDGRGRTPDVVGITLTVRRSKHNKQGVALTGRNTTGPLSRAAPWWLTLHMWVSQTTTDGRRRQTPATVTSLPLPYTMCMRASNNFAQNKAFVAWCRNRQGNIQSSRVQSPLVPLSRGHRQGFTHRICSSRLYGMEMAKFRPSVAPKLLNGFLWYMEYIIIFTSPTTPS